MAPLPILLDVPVLCQAVPTRSARGMDVMLPGQSLSWWGWIWSLLLWEMG